MKYLITLLFISLLFLSKVGFGQLFMQNFSSSGTVSDYVSATPNNTQFTSITSTGTSTTVSINGGALQIERIAADNVGYFGRSAAFLPTPASLIVQFSLEVPARSSAVTTAFIFRIGEGSSFNNTGSSPINDDTFAYFGINFTANNNEFQLRNITTDKNSGTFIGMQTITWVLNKSGSGLNYAAPNGLNATVANNTWDLWVGATNVFDDAAPLTASKNITQFKCMYNSTASIATYRILFDNFSINTPPSLLPVNLLSFTAFAQKNNALISWETVWERENDYFEVQKSIDGKNFFTIGRLSGRGTSSTKHSYQFIDSEPHKGVNYYRLKQIDLDGKINLSKIISLYFESNEEAFEIFPNPTSSLDINIIFSAQTGNLLNINLIDALGRNISTENYTYKDQPIQLKSDERIAKGIYFVVIRNISTGKMHTRKLVID